jgi:hypothetical protein
LGWANFKEGRGSRRSLACLWLWGRSEGQFANRALICDGSSKSKPSRSHLEGRGSLHVVHDDVAADARQSGSQAVRQTPCTALLRCKENARGMQTQTRMRMRMQVQVQVQTSPARKAASSALRLSRIAPATEMSVSLEEGGETRDQRRETREAKGAGERGWPGCKGTRNW